MGSIVGRMDVAGRAPGRIAAVGHCVDFQGYSPPIGGTRRTNVVDLEGRK